MANRFLSNIRINDAYTFPASDGSSGQVITTDGSGNLSFAEAGTSDAASVIYRDNFTGDGSTVAFDLQNSITDEDQTQIYIDGVYQEKDTYSVSGTTITFATAPISGHSVEVISISAINTGPTVIYQDNFTGNGSTTDFTLAQVIDNEVKTFVFLNGVYQFKGTYAVDSTTLSFDTAPANGVDIEVISIASALQTDSLQAGSVIVPVKNTHTASIAKGTPVYITGNVGNSERLQIAPADASNSAKMPAAGLLLTTLAVNEEGYVITGGYLRNLTTDTIDGTSTSPNNTVYVKPGGGLTMTKPTGSNLIQNIAKVARSAANSGSLLVSSILRTNDVPNITNDYFWLGNSSGVATATSYTSRFDTAFATKDTDDLSEGTSNLYYTDARARSAISVSGNAISYNSSTGVITSNYEESPTFTGSVNITGGTTNGLNITTSGTQETIKIDRAATIDNAITKYQTASTDKWIVGLRNTGDDNFRFYNYGTSSDVLVIDTSGNATFAGTIYASNNNPAYSFASDTNTGMSRTGTHQIGFINQGNTSLTLDALSRATFAGNVGVAGKTPTYGLSLAQGTGAGNKIAWTDGAPNFAASIYASSSTDKLTFATKNSSNVETTALEIDTSQNATFAPTGGVITLGANGHITSNQSLDVATAGGRLTGKSNRGYLASIHLEQVATGADGGEIYFMTAPNGTTAGTRKLEISSAGEVTLGTGTNNAGFLDFDSTNLQLNTQRNPNTGAFVDTNKSHAHIGLQGANGGSQIIFGTAAANNTVASERMRIDSSGNILIAKTSQNINSVGTELRANGQSLFTADGDNAIDLNRLTNDGGIALFRQAATVVGSISVTGSATAYNTSSDYRLKEDLQDFNGLDKVSKIPVYDFKWKTDESRSYGVMAHELQEVLPDAVSGDKDAEEMQGVDYSKIVPFLIKSIQELKADNDSLKARIETLENN